MSSFRVALGLIGCERPEKNARSRWRLELLVTVVRKVGMTLCKIIIQIDEQRAHTLSSIFFKFRT
jgi:hypothetical protein